MDNLHELLHVNQNSSTPVIAVASAFDPPVLRAICQAIELNLVKPILIGIKNDIQAYWLKNFPKTVVPEIIDESELEKIAEISVNLVKTGKAQILMKGLIPSGIILRAVINKTNGIGQKRILSHVALFQSEYYHKLFAVTDAAMNIAPSVNDKIDLIVNAIDVLKKIKVGQFKVALVTPLEYVNEKIQSTVDAKQIKIHFQSIQNNDFIVDGPFALDNAISREAALHKGIISEVSGDADLLVVPDLNAGNIFYKSLIFLGGAKTASIITGASAPIVLTSRSDSEESKLLSIALACKLLN